MNEVSYKKSEIALHQLKAAIKLFHEKDYISALTLAGATQEIVSKLCRAKGLVWSHRLPAETQEVLLKKSSKKIEKYLADTLNKTKNELKHHSSSEDEIIKADFYFEAEMFILSAVDNYIILFGKLPNDKIIVDFYNEYNV